MEKKIRLAEMSDIDEVTNLYNITIDYLEENINYPAWKKDIYPTKQSAQDALNIDALFVYVEEGKIAGSVILNSLPVGEYGSVEWGITAADHEVLIVHTLLVHPDFGGKGIAKSLVDFTKEHAKENGFKAVRLDVYEINTPASKLYEKNGFKFIGQINLEEIIFKTLGLSGIKMFNLYEYIV